ncbi:MAG: GNAT family N-acetyltransferase [Clostridium sp.]
MIENMKVEFGRTSDIDSWMRLVRKVSWNFPGLETEQSIDEHKIIVLKFMNDKRALCVKNEQEIVGVLLYSRKYNMICCLAVDPAYRKRGIASLLLREAIDKLDRGKDITVSTFRENNVKGIAPRKLYKKFGFEEDELIEEFGYPNQRFVLHADKSVDNVIIGTKSYIEVRRFKEEDAQEVRNLIVRNFLEVNSKDYGISAMEKLAKAYDAEKVLNVASYAHMYVFEFDGKIIGTGSISSFWGSETESILLSIFVLPEFHGKGVGRKIINTLETDEFYVRASRIEILASITATEFYRKFGYDYKNGVKELDNEHHYRLEKFKEAGLK